MKNEKLDPLPAPPPDYDCFLSGQYLKIGRFNRIFVFRLGEWVITHGISLEAVHRSIEEQAHKIDVIAPVERRKYPRKEIIKNTDQRKPVISRSLV